jgi:hypothetical protein
MATSTEKLLDFIDLLSDHDDDELAQMFPVPPGIARMALAAASARIPTDPAMLDEWALAAAAWCLQHRSDEAPAVDLQQIDGQTVGELLATPLEAEGEG